MRGFLIEGEVEGGEVFNDVGLLELFLGGADWLLKRRGSALGEGIFYAEL